MAIDPSIIGNVMAPAATQLPDVNAMMQTRTAGLENVYKIEQQRAEQAKADAKEREDAAIDALIPAYVHGLENPEDYDGMLALVPPDLRANVAPYIDQIRGLPPEQVRSVLTSSLLSSDRGKAFLDNQARQKTYEVQLGQLTLAQQEAQRKADEAAMGPRVSPDVQARIDWEREQAAAKKAAEEASGGLDPKVKLKLDQSYPQASRALQSSVTNLQSDISDVERLLADEKGLKSITGALNAATPNIFADATRAQALLDKIMSGAGFSALQAMRDASPTGGALGNVSNQEGSKLEKSVAAFSQAQSYEDFREALRQYLIDLKIAQENVQSAFDETYSYRGEAPSAGIVEETTKRRGRIEQETAPASPKISLPPGVTVKRN